MDFEEVEEKEEEDEQEENEEESEEEYEEDEEEYEDEEIGKFEVDFFVVVVVEEPGEYPESISSPSFSFSSFSDFVVVF